MAIFGETREEDTEETTVGDLEETGEEEEAISMEIAQIIKDHQTDLTTTLDRHPSHHLFKTALQKFDELHLP